MKTNKRLITTLTVFVLILLTSIFCMTVFAEKTKEKEKEKETTTTVAPVVSGCDLKKEDLKMAKVEMADFSMLVPKGDIVTAESDSSVFEKAKITYNLDRQTFISESVFFYFNTNKENYCQVYAGFVDINPVEGYFGDYSNLTAEQQQELIAQNTSQGDTSSKGRFEKINGRTYLMISKTADDSDTNNKYSLYALYTVIGSRKYIVQVVVLNPDKSDYEVVNEMLNSIKLGGFKEPVSPLTVVLIVCVVILLLAVAFAYFTLYRLDKFVKSGASDVKMFGLNLPEPASSEDDADDDDGAEIDDFDDDADDETDTVSLSKDEKIIDEE